LHNGIEHDFHAAAEFAIRPRALTLTMFVRLFLADLFVHGIGGALYDQIADALLAKLFNQSLPYACVSAAWLLPLGQPLESSGTINELKSRRHHLLHNPQPALKQPLLEKITTSLAASRHNPQSIAQRREWFEQLHTLNAELHAKSPHLLQQLDEQIIASHRAVEQNKVLLSREYFFALHTTESLRQFIEKVRRA